MSYEDEACLMIDFGRRVFCRYVGGETFELWLRNGNEESPVRRLPGRSLKALICDRHCVIAVPIHLERDGRHVVIGWNDGPGFDEEWARCHSEVFRDLIKRAVRARSR